MNIATARENSFIHLDFIRGLAAVAVMAGHLRAYLFVTPDKLDESGWLSKAFYFATGFGHEAVIIFFALSGFFITKSITGLIQRDQWSWRYYLVHRVSRLWAVLIPSLLLTAILDFSGIALTDGSYYAGEYASHYARGPDIVTGGVDLTIGTFFSNLFFLQIIYTPTYGTNYPLWSLAYEFWYYILFPLAFIPFVKTTSIKYKVASLGIFACLVYWLPLHILQLGIVWLMGAVTYLIYRRQLFYSVFKSRSIIAMALICSLLTVCAIRAGLFPESVYGDYGIGLTTCFLFLTIVELKAFNPLYRYVSNVLSNISYTLYAIHDPVMAFSASVFLGNSQGGFNGVSIGLFILGFSGMLLFAYLIYWCFERNTHHLSEFLMKKTAIAAKTALTPTGGH